MEGAYKGLLRQEKSIFTLKALFLRYQKHHFDRQSVWSKQVKACTFHPNSNAFTLKTHVKWMRIITTPA